MDGLKDELDFELRVVALIKDWQNNQAKFANETSKSVNAVSIRAYLIVSVRLTLY